MGGALSCGVRAGPGSRWGPAGGSLPSGSDSSRHVRWCCTSDRGAPAGRLRVFRLIPRLFLECWFPACGLPCAERGVYAHGSKTITATDVAVPHDSAVPTDTERTRVCNTHHPRPTQASVEPARGGEARPMRSSAPRHRTPHRSDGVRPISTRGTTDLGTECDRSRRGVRPISARVATDLGAGFNRSRCGIRPISRRVECGVLRVLRVFRRRGAARGTTWAGPARRRAHSRSA